MFVGRKKELVQFKKFFSGDSFQTMLLYGRRRVGKTELIKQVLKDLDFTKIYYEAKEVSLSLNLLSLENCLKKALSLSPYIHFSSLEEAFEAVFIEAKKRKIVLVLDEFSYFPIMDNVESADSSLANVIDKYKGDDCHLKLVVSGSYINVLTKMIEKNRPLHGRFTSTIYLKEFDYYDASLFFPNYSCEEKFETYCCFSGLPYVLSLIDQNKSVEENIKELYCEPNNILDLFVRDTLLGEVSKVDNLNAILSLIGQGKTKYNDLLAVLGKNSRIEYALEKLVIMNLIKKNYPINQKSNKKLTSYSFKDNLLFFYYRYIFFAQNSREIQGSEVFFNENIKENLQKEYLPKLFEKVSKEFLIRRNKKGLLDMPFSEIGNYYYNDRYNKKNVQFDVVTLDKKGYISYECKYMKHPISMSTIREEETQTKKSNLLFYRLGFISKSGFDIEINRDKYNLYSLDDFYNKELEV